MHTKYINLWDKKNKYILCPYVPTRRSGTRGQRFLARLLHVVTINRRRKDRNQGRTFLPVD